MHTRRWFAALLAALLALTITPAALAQPATDSSAGASANAPFGREPAERGPAPFRGLGRFQEAEPSAKLPAQPRNDVLEDAPVDPNDASLLYDLIPYHEFAPRLRELQESDRISVEVIGQSIQGRDLHLVVATSPMSDGEWDEWQRLSDLRTDDPDAAVAAFEAGEYDDWKLPLFINNNIHGNEWEGTDASFAWLEELAFSDDPEVLDIVDNNVVVFVISNNPDGRVNATRANALGFDMNRDWITQSQPEVRIVRDQIIRYDPVTFLDIHGYVACTLIEPTTGPHGENYEYDLYIRQALRHALAMEDAILARSESGTFCTTASGTSPAGVPRIRIPYRNNTTGWDDWPPIFTPMYAMYHGAIGHTVEVPLNPRGQSAAVRVARAATNTRVGIWTIEGSFAYVSEARESLLADQLELFRRGANGESSRPIDDPLALSVAAGDNADTILLDFPRAYVIPVGADQRSETSAARLAQFLIDNDVRVHQARTPVTIDGVHYPAGSYVVDMHQAKRGLANTILGSGTDVTTLYPTMYDISAWSQGLLWGATVEVVEEGELDTRQLIQVSEATATQAVKPGNRAAFGLTVDSLNGVQAVNALLRGGADVSRLPDGTFVVRADNALVRSVAADTGVSFDNLPASRIRGAEPFTAYRIATSAPFDEVFALERMGFEVTPVNQAGFNNGTYAFEDFDGLYVGNTTFNPQSLNATQQAAFAEWLAGGANIVLRAGAGFTFNGRANLLDIGVSNGPGSANGIVAVVNDPDSPIVGDAPDTSFVSAPRWVSRVGEGVRVEQQLLDDPGFFLAGHWIGQQNAIGAPLVVSGNPRGANVSFFGSEPLYRSHPEGLYEQVAEALWWDGS